ncbi:TadE family type IV pilus minor pilin [Actinotignum timonense]|nr:TadE family type IV pilus minor pilin [Actinotignum timonense]MDK6906877.1 TadE family type IV pilus minor pilin [Actinotignum timonense]MDK8782682.1 TadE family type IV pilus minor pilin [Actinotignum timonense]MDY5156257.1 TadE family type IV pilus minor pilin [Actinotignum timonense]
MIPKQSPEQCQEFPSLPRGTDGEGALLAGPLAQPVRRSRERRRLCAQCHEVIEARGHIAIPCACRRREIRSRKLSRILRRPYGVENREAGMVTVEVALGIVSVLIIVLLALGALSAGAQYISLRSASHDIAVLAARGESEESLRARELPPRAKLHLQRAEDHVNVVVRAQAVGPLRALGITMEASTSVDLEPGVLGT